LELLGVECASIVGHDLGGGVALRLATLLPERVARLGLLNAVCYDSWPIEGLLQLGHRQVARQLSPAAMATLLRLVLRRGFKQPVAPEVLDALLAPYATEVGKVSLVRAAAALDTNHTTEIVPLLPRITAPTLIVWGQDDPFQLPRYGDRLAWDIPDARLIR